MRGNTITLRLIKGAIGQASGLFQYDYGQKLVLSGVELPANYEVHFSNCEYGNSKTMLGNSTGVDIPDEYLLSGEDVHVWLFLHDGADDGETEYHGIINVVRRAQPTDEPPTPQEQSVIAQAIAALNGAIEQTAQDVVDTNAAKEAAESAAESAEDARDEAVSAKDTAVYAKDSAENARDTAVSAKDAAIAARDAAEASADAAEAAKDIAEEAVAQISSVIDDEAGQGVTDKTWSADKILQSIPEVPVKDVKIDGSSVVGNQGSANIPKADVSTFGVMRAPNPVSSGLQMDPLGYLKTTEANISQVQGGTNEYRVIVPDNQHEAVFFGLAKAAGRDLKDVRNVTVGQYPENAKTAIRNMLGVAGGSGDLDQKADKTDTVLNTTLSRGRNTSSSVGTASVAFGTNVIASGLNSQAFGSDTQATNTTAHAEGNGTRATGPSAHAEGDFTYSESTGSHAEGTSTHATSYASHAEGSMTTASGYASHSEGYHSQATDSYAHAEGSYTNATGQASHAEGQTTTASGTNSHAEGSNTTASGTCSHAEGVRTIANSYLQHVFGRFNVSDPNGSAATPGKYVEIVGNGSDTATRSNARSLDWQGNEYLMGDLYINCNPDGTGGTKVGAGGGADFNNPVFTGSVSMGRTSGSPVGANSTALGTDVIATAANAHAEGGGAQATGEQSHAEGAGSHATGFASHAEGGGTRAIGDRAHAEGSGTNASGAYSHAEGGGTKATAIGAHAEGGGTQATATNAHTEGGGTQAYGAQSHAEGGSTQAAGDCSHAEGYQSVAGGFYSHAEGNRSYANGDSMHASGSHNYIPALYASWTANTQYQVGDRVTYANGHAYGYECITANNDSSFDSSKWEVLPYNGEFAEIVGNGKNNDSSNAYALKWDGTGLYAGDVYVHCDKFSNVGYKLISAADVATTTETQAIITEYGVSA
jgi:hypothetical protein